jgi:hypothetical protein
MSNLTAIDADGHIIENENDIRKYLKEPWNQRSTALREVPFQIAVARACND